MNTNNDHPDLEKLPLEVDGIPVRETVREIFRNPDNGTPDNISKAGCLALARMSNVVGGVQVHQDGGHTERGHLIWNSWRKQFPVDGNPEPPINNADFSGSIFHPGFIRFSGFDFGSHADFSHAQFLISGGDFEGTRWGEKSSLRGTRFFFFPNFNGAHWGNFADFRGASIGGRASFEGARWGAAANFCGMQCAESANFRKARWGAHANFEGAIWGDEADFYGAQWDYAATFRNTVFGARATFMGALWGTGCDFRFATFESNVYFNAASWDDMRRAYMQRTFLNEMHEAGLTDWEEAKQWSDRVQAAPNSFREIDFSGAQFGGVAHFDGRVFLGGARFGVPPEAIISQAVCRNSDGLPCFDENGQLKWKPIDRPRKTEFGQPPRFHDCELPQDTSFDDASFPAASGSQDSARAYQTLKLAFSNQQAIREEQRFFRLEMEEETLRETGIKRWLFKRYKQFSDYGFSVTRPFILWVAAWLVFAHIYGYSSGQEVCWVWHSGCDLRWDWLGYSLQQALPLPGFDKLDHTIKGVSVGWLFLHKTISLTALFLIGLALRNLFKLK